MKHCSNQRGVVNFGWVGGWVMKISQQRRKKMKKEEEEDLLKGNMLGVNVFTLGGTWSFTFRYLSYSVIKIIRRECGLNAVAAHLFQPQESTTHGLHVHLWTCASIVGRLVTVCTKPASLPFSLLYYGHYIFTNIFCCIYNIVQYIS